LNSRDANHSKATEVLSAFRGQLVTTTTIVTETMHFLIHRDGGPQLFLEFLRISKVKIIDFCQVPDVERAVRLMAKYADTPMDFADATLVLLSDSLNEHHICTIDRRGFNTFRTPSGKRFTLVMGGT
jgi:predicted nucleic acid-binding protein